MKEIYKYKQNKPAGQIDRRDHLSMVTVANVVRSGIKKYKCVDIEFYIYYIIPNYNQQFEIG